MTPGGPRGKQANRVKENCFARRRRIAFCCAAYFPSVEKFSITFRALVYTPHRARCNALNDEEPRNPFRWDYALAEASPPSSRLKVDSRTFLFSLEITRRDCKRESGPFIVRGNIVSLARFCSSDRESLESRSSVFEIVHALDHIISRLNRHIITATLAFYKGTRAVAECSRGLIPT